MMVKGIQSEAIVNMGIPAEGCRTVPGAARAVNRNGVMTGLRAILTPLLRERVGVRGSPANLLQLMTVPSRIRDDDLRMRRVRASYISSATTM